jgi:O-antigen/teichoic acid export membrane protein
VRRLSRNVLANVVTVAATLGTALVSVPLIIDRVGLSGYGIWTLALTGIVYVTTAEAGVGPAVQRFTAVAHGGADLQTAARLLWSTVALYLALGLVFVIAALLLAPTFVDAFDVAHGLRGDARAMFEIAGLVGLLALVAVGLGNVQQGLERYPSYAASGAAGAVVFLVGMIVALESGAGLSGLAWAAVVQQGSIAFVRAWALRDVMRVGVGLVTAAQARTIGGFSLRVSMTAVSMLVNLQTDKIVVGVVASGATLGQLGIGGQIAEAGRLIAGAALSPIVSRMSATHGGADPAALGPLFARLHRLWTLTIFGLTVVGIASLYPLIATWLGAGHGKAAALGAFLVVAYGMNLLTGPGVAYLRAVGKPGVEGRLGVVTIVVNVVLTVALGVAFGAFGVVAATMCAFTIGMVWFYFRLRRETGLDTPLPGARVVLAALLAGAASLGWGLACVELLGRWVGLVPVGAGAVAAFMAYLSFATGVRPTVANLRAHFA